METVFVALVLLTIILESKQYMMPWDRWSWSLPQEPIEYFFRRQGSLPVKSPSLKCNCPPHNECVVEFKVNQDMADFLNIRGVIKREDLKKFREDLKNLAHSDGGYRGDVEKAEAVRKRRRSWDDESNSCCCPSKNVLMPAFITDKKFDDLTIKFQEKPDITES